MRSFLSLLIGSCFCCLPGLITGSGTFTVSAFEDITFLGERETEGATSEPAQLPETLVEPDKRPRPFQVGSQIGTSATQLSVATEAPTFPDAQPYEETQNDLGGKLRRSDNVAQLPIYLTNGETAGQVSEVVLTAAGELAYVVVHYRHQDYFVPPRFLQPGRVGGTLELRLQPGQMEAIPKFWSHRWPSLSDPALPIEIESHFAFATRSSQDSTQDSAAGLSTNIPGQQALRSGQVRRPGPGNSSSHPLSSRGDSGTVAGPRPSLDLGTSLAAPGAAVQSAVNPLLIETPAMAPAETPGATLANQADNETNGATGLSANGGALVVPTTGAGVAAGRNIPAAEVGANLNPLNAALFGGRGGLGATGGTTSTGVGNSLPAIAFPGNTAGSATTTSGGGTSQVRSPQANPTIIGQPGVIGTNGGTAVVAPSNSIGGGTAGEATVINGAMAPQTGAAAVQNRGNIVGTGSNSSQFPTTSNSAIINNSGVAGNVGAATRGGNIPNRSGFGNGVNNVNSTGAMSGGRSGVSPSNRATIGGGPSPTTGSQSPGGAPIQPAASPSGLGTTGTGATGGGAGRPR